MEEKPSYYAIIPATVRYDERLKANEKLLFGEITSLTNKTGECWATNKYFADLYKVSIRSVQCWLSNLEKNEYIRINFIKNTDIKDFTQRIITLGGEENFTGGGKNLHGGYEENFTHNNTSNNNKNNKKEIYKEKPTLEEVKEYCKERNNNVDPKKFFDYYEVNNWIDNKGNKVKSWKQKVITWENHSPDNVELPDWFNKDIKVATDKDKEKEMEDLLKEFKNG